VLIIFDQNGEKCQKLVNRKRDIVKKRNEICGHLAVLWQPVCSCGYGTA